METKKPPFDAQVVANALLDICESEGHIITQLVLHKTLYFAHGWHLAAYGVGLIKNSFEAWDHGPVLRVLRHDFKKFKGEKIVGQRATYIDLYAGHRMPAPTPEDDYYKEFIRNTFLSLSHLSGYQLSEMTHEEGSPWHQIRQRSEREAIFGLRIPDELIRLHFADKAGMINSKS
jgi:uncharacterized phage-associated protein